MEYMPVEVRYVMGLAKALLIFFVGAILIFIVFMAIATIGVPDSGPVGNYRYTYVGIVAMMIGVIWVWGRWSFHRKARQLKYIKNRVEHERAREVFNDRYR